MKRLLLVAIVCLSVGHGLGIAQKRSPYQYWGDLRTLSCGSWTPTAAIYANGYDSEKMRQHAPEHAWAYGFVAGAGYMPSALDRSRERLMQIDVRGIDARIDRYCATHQDSTLEAALGALVKELAAMR